MQDAQITLRRLGIIARSGERDRRPTLDELNKLMNHFTGRETRYPHMMPMRSVIAFAIFSTRRQEEISRITRKDVEPEHGRILVKDMKNPSEKLGNDN